MCVLVPEARRDSWDMQLKTPEGARVAVRRYQLQAVLRSDGLQRREWTVPQRYTIRRAQKSVIVVL